MTKGRKAGVVLLVTALVLVGLLVLADRGAVWAAEDQIARRVAAKAQERDITMKGEPEVNVEGFPFLTQVMAGEYQAITIGMREVSLGGILIDTLDVRATDVRADVSEVMRGSGDVVAGQVTGKATVPFSAVEEFIGKEGASVTEQNGKMLIRMPVTAPGGQVEVTAVITASVKVVDGTLRVEVEDVTTEEEVPSFAESALRNAAGSLAREIPIPQLPYGLQLTDAEVTSGGVVAIAEAKDVPLVS